MSTLDMKDKLTPSSSYCCAICNIHLFTNLEIIFPEREKATAEIDLLSDNASVTSPKGAAFTLTKPKSRIKFTRDGSNLRSRKTSIENEETPSIVNGLTNNPPPNTGLQSIRESRDNLNDYRFCNIFTSRPHFLSDSVKETYGFLMCPNRNCNQKLGIFSVDGMKC